jgi:hypothetical protein
MKISLRILRLRLLSIILLVMFYSCSSHPVRFRDSEPVRKYNDMIPIPIPQATEYKEFDDVFNTILRQPVVNAFDFSRTEPSKDVNSMDDVPASSWFTPRLGYRDINPDELLRGPLKYGPPQAPIKIISGKFAGLTPGFIAEDSRGIEYLFKFDPKDFPGIESTAALIANRLFWGFGYNVPEDYFYYLSKEDLYLEPSSSLTQTNVDSIFGRASQEEYGWIRCTVSKVIDGIILGPFSANGVRKDDPNDRIPHEKRRTLRALRVFSAFANYTDLRLDNTLDVYVGKPNKGYVKHYLLDFGGALGAFSAEEQNLWEGSNHLFSFSETSKNLITAGLYVQDWERLEYTPWKSVGAFESKIFRPEKWRETYPFTPVHQSRPADNYWAAKILGALKYEHIEMLVRGANYPEVEAADYVIKILMERQKKTVEYFLTQVSPVEPVNFRNEELHCKDMAKILIGGDYINARYQIQFFDDSGKEVAKHKMMENKEAHFQVTIPEELINKANGYLRVDIKVFWEDRTAPTPAQFHIRRGNGGTLQLVGVVH